MKRHVIHTEDFSSDCEKFIQKRKLSLKDFEEFKDELAKNPTQGDIIPGTGGIRKTRLKSVSKGKRGGFRVCYLDVEDKIVLFLLSIYQKNEQEDLTPAQKTELKSLSEYLKRSLKNEQAIQKP